MPDDMVLPRLNAIRGVCIVITQLKGKFKLNQDKSRDDQLGVLEGQEAGDDPQAHSLAKLMRRYLLLELDTSA